jgi:hypothetical protein
MSCIDRFVYNKEDCDIISRATNWSVSFSDHAVIELEITSKKCPPMTRSKIVRLDASLLLNGEIRTRIEDELKSMLVHMPLEWNPHTKQEYAKMCLRTVTEKAQADVKKKERDEEEILNEELDLAVKSLANRTHTRADAEEIIEHIESLRSEKSRLIELKGERLAARLKTKWYCEGEKSTKYFLRLLNSS